MADTMQSPLDVARQVLAAWEALPGGRNYGPKVIESWLATHMAPVINKLRAVVAHEEKQEVDAWERRYRTGFEDGEKHAAEGQAAVLSQEDTYRHIIDELAQKKITVAAIDVIKERRRQVEAEGWTPEHDDAHSDASLALAAGSYCESAARPKILARKPGAAFAIPKLWPPSWSRDWWKPKSPREDLVRAGALILAEIERIDRAAANVATGAVE